jgi:hypothetical protein
LAGVALLRDGAGPPRFVRVAAVAVADVELIPHDREHHRVGAVQKLAVFDGLEVHVRDNVRGAVAVPTQLVADFGLETQRTGQRDAVYGQLDRR